MQVEAEVVRLERLKECRMKDLVLKKYDELNEIRRRAHVPVENEDDAMMMFDAIDSGNNWLGALVSVQLQW
jgi:protein regulator of cytokinesis 1